MSVHLIPNNALGFNSAFSLTFDTMERPSNNSTFLCFRTFLAAREASFDCHKQKCPTSRVQSQDYSTQGEGDDSDER